MSQPISDLDGDAVPREIDEALIKLKFLKARPLKEYPQTSQICQELRDKYLTIKPFMPLLSALKNPDFKAPHFAILEKDYSFKIEGTLSESLYDLKKEGVLDHVDEIVELSAIATKEH